MRSEERRRWRGRQTYPEARWHCEEPGCGWLGQWGQMMDVAPDAIRHVLEHARADAQAEAS